MRKLLAAAGLLAAGLCVSPFVRAKAAQRSSPVAPVAAAPVVVALAQEKSIFLVGAHDARRGWINDRQAKAVFRRGAVFTAFNARGEVGKTTTGATEVVEPGGGWMATGNRAFAAGTPLLALSGANRPLPRRPRAQSLHNPVYQQAVAALLRAQKLRVRQAKLTQHWRVDLNGDGTDEVLLAAHSRPQMGREARAFKGDYALVMLRFLHNGKVKTVPLTGDIYRKDALGGAVAAMRFTLLGCFDMNRDGTLEIAVGGRYYEGESVEVFSFDGKTARRVLEAGWGA